MRFLRILRRAAYTILALLLALWVFVQFQQRLLRHRAERLHDEIVALQLHPGTFADIQRMQKEWGRFAHFDGECTRHHCIYQIGLSDWTTKGGTRMNSLSYLIYAFLGGRAVRAGASIGIREDRMWMENFAIGAFVLTFDDAHAFMLFADLHGGPHLFRAGDEWYGEALKLGYLDGFEGACTGCTGADIVVTPQTAPEDVAWLTLINFSCITRWWPCRTEYQFLPEAWPHHHNYGFRGPGEPDTPFDEQNVRAAPIQTLGREAPEAILMQLVDLVPWSEDQPNELGMKALILERLKNASSLQPGNIAKLPAGDIIDSDPDMRHLTPGDRYIVALWDTKNALDGITIKAIIPATPANLSAFRVGVAQDPLGRDDIF